MKLSIVITTRNRPEDLDQCIQSIRNSESLPIDWELIIVDDCSVGGPSIPEAINGIINVHYLYNDSQKMMVKSRNRGARAAKGEYILFIDDDNMIDSSMITSLIHFFNCHPEYGIIGPSMYFWSSKEKYMDYQQFNFFTGKTSGCVTAVQKEVFPSDGIPNVFMVRRSVFEQYGFFDEQLIQTFTEPDFAFHMRSLGIQCGMIPTAKTYHNAMAEGTLAPRKMGGAFTQKAYCLMRNRSVLIARYGRWYHTLIYGLLFSWCWPMVYSSLMIPYQRFDLVRLYWKGYIDGMLYVLTGHLRAFRV